MDSRLVAAGLMAAVFVSGAVTGGVLSRTVFDDGPRVERRWEGDRRDAERRGPDRRRDGPPRDPRALMSSRAVDYLTERLELDPAQRDSVEAVLERQRQRASAVFDEVGPRLRTVLDSTNLQIRGLLGPEQQTEFDTLIREEEGILGRRYVPPDSARGR